MSAAVASRPFVRRVYAMGTVFNFDIRTPARPAELDEAMAEAEAWLHRVDATFSTYKPLSEVNRFDRGQLTAESCSAELRSIVALCHELSAKTGAYFDAWASGRFDPSGVVKGWSVDRASELLRERDLADHCIEGGGDIRLRGSPGPGAGQRWAVGVRHPLRKDAYCAALRMDEGAVATSGNYERGPHVLDPLTGVPADAVAGVTVVGPELTMADAYATAALAMGRAAPGWLGELEGYESLVVGLDGTGWRSAGFGQLSVA